MVQTAIGKITAWKENNMPKYTIDVDIVAIKAKLDSGKLRAKINPLGGVLIEDTISGEAIKVMQLPDTYSFHEKGKWEPQFIYTHNQVDNYMQGKEGWACSECGWVTDEKHDWCTCGADMRESKKINQELQDLLEVL